MRFSLAGVFYWTTVAAVMLAIWVSRDRLWIVLSAILILLGFLMIAEADSQPHLRLFLRRLRSALLLGCIAIFMVLVVVEFIWFIYLVSTGKLA